MIKTAKEITVTIPGEYFIGYRGWALHNQRCNFTETHFIPSLSACFFLNCSPIKKVYYGLSLSDNIFGTISQ